MSGKSLFYLINIFQFENRRNLLLGCRQQLFFRKQKFRNFNSISTKYSKISKQLRITFLGIKLLPFAREKTAIGLFHFSLFCLWSIQEIGLFKRSVYLANLLAGRSASCLIRASTIFPKISKNLAIEIKPYSVRVCPLCMHIQNSSCQNRQPIHTFVALSYLADHTSWRRRWLIGLCISNHARKEDRQFNVLIRHDASVNIRLLYRQF